MHIHQLERTLLWKYPFARGYHTFTMSSLVDVVISHTQSHIIAQNSNIIRCAMFYGMAGTYRKDSTDSLLYGRFICNQVKTQFTCDGFFTSDELPQYGIGRMTTYTIYRQLGKKSHDGNLIFILAYDRSLSEKIYYWITDYYAHRFYEALYLHYPKAT